MTNNQLPYKTSCLLLIEKKLNWGSSVDWSNQDFEKLSVLIHEQTNVLLSVSTLKRVWGKVQYNHRPTHSTMDALVNFLGYESWRSFVTEQEALSEKKLVHVDRFWAPYIRHKTGLIRATIITTFLLVAGALLYKFSNKEHRLAPPLAVKSEDYTFSSKPITRSIPNSVVFTYDANKSPTDSIFIQQNWDPNRRKAVSKQGTTHTSIYYEPGHYNAKLIIGEQTVKEHSLLIPTEGWLATISHAPIPIYLQSEDFIAAKQLNVTAATLKKYKVDPSTELTDVTYYNVGNFDPVPVHRFEFSAQVKNNALKALDPCQRSGIGFITEQMPISFPLSTKGCISDLTVTSVDGFFSGKEHDLSKFGADLSKWVDVKCIGTPKSIQYYVNDVLAYEAPLLSDTLHILGMVYGFSGGGAVQHIRLSSGDKTIFEAF